MKLSPRQNKSMMVTGDIAYSEYNILENMANMSSSDKLLGLVAQWLS